MQERLREMLDSSELLKLNKRQAQYLALQNQINPHFLYNTLESIRSEALTAGLSGPGPPRPCPRRRRISG